MRPWLPPHDVDHPIIFGCDNHSTHQDDTGFWEKDTWQRGEYIVNIASMTSKFTQPNDSDSGPNHTFKPLYTKEIISIMEAKIDSGDTYMTCIDMVEAFSRAFLKMKPSWAAGSFYDNGVFRRHMVHPDEGAPPGVVRRVYAEPAVVHNALAQRGWVQQEGKDGNVVWVNRHQESESNPTRRDLEISPEDADAVQLAKDRLLEWHLAVNSESGPTESQLTQKDVLEMALRCMETTAAHNAEKRRSVKLAAALAVSTKALENTRTNEARKEKIKNSGFTLHDMSKVHNKDGLNANIEVQKAANAKKEAEKRAKQASKEAEKRAKQEHTSTQQHTSTIVTMMWLCQQFSIGRATQVRLSTPNLPAAASLYQA